MITADEEGLEKIADDLRDESKRILFTRYIKDVCELFIDNNQLRYQCLRVLANCAGYCDQNVDEIMVQSRFIAELMKYEPDENVLRAQQALVLNLLSDKYVRPLYSQYGEVLIRMVERNTEISALIFEVLVESKVDLTGIDISAIEYDDSVLALIVQNEAVEQSFAKSSRDLIGLLEAVPQCDVRLSIGALGNITSSKDVYCEVSLDDPLFAAVYTLFKTLPSVGCVVLGNLCGTKEKLGDLLKIEPDLCPKAIQWFLSIEDPIELQGVHLLVNLVQFGPRDKGVDLGVKLISYKFFPFVRVLGVKLLGGLLPFEPCNDVLIRLWKTEDDPSVRGALVMATCTAIEIYHNVELITILLQNLPTDSAQAMLKITKSIGVASKDSESLNKVPTEDIKGLLSLYPMFDKPIQQNLLYIANHIDSPMVQNILTTEAPI